MNDKRPPISKERALHWHDISTMKPEDFGDAQNLPSDIAELIYPVKPNISSLAASVLIEHFDLGPPSETDDSIVYAPLFLTAKQACLQ